MHIPFGFPVIFLFIIFFFGEVMNCCYYNALVTFMKVTTDVLPVSYLKETVKENSKQHVKEHTA